jgi:hypothetical protein
MAIDVANLLRQLLLLYDPTLDVTAGARLDTTVITPMVQRVDPQLTQTSAAAFLNARITEAYPELDGYGFEDSTLLPAQVLATSVQRELARIEAILTSPRFENLTLEEARLRAAQYFVYGADGTRAQVRIRVYFATLRDRIIPLDATFYGTNNLRFYPISPKNVLVEEQEQDPETGEYYYDVLCYAENTGTRYNTLPGTIRVVTGVPGAARCNNLSRQTIDGVDGDTQSTLYEKTLNTAERSLTKVGGITLYIEEVFPTLYDKVRVVRAGDDEMIRDRMRVVLEIVGDPVMYVGSAIASLSGTGTAEQLNPYPGLSPDVTNLFTVDASVIGMSPGDIISVDDFDIPILEVDTVSEQLLLNSIVIRSYGGGMFPGPYLVYGGADLLRTDILSVPSGTLLEGTSGDRLYAEKWPDPGSKPTTYDLEVSGGKFRVAPIINIFGKGVCDPYVATDIHQIFDVGGTHYGFQYPESTGQRDWRAADYQVTRRQ